MRQDETLRQAIAAWQAGRADEAERLARQAGERAEAWILRGMAARRRGDAEAAIAAYRHALTLDARQPDAYNNLANALKDLDRNEEAIPLYREALKLQPAAAQTLANLGGALHAVGRIDEAADTLAQAVALAPDNADAHWDYALALLHQGNYRSGLQEYEWRWRRRQPEPRALPGPEWDGGALDGRTVFVHAEQGLGDAIQCLRFLPELARRGGRVMLEVQADLLPLVRELPAVAALLVQGEPIPPYDCHVALMSLPLKLGLTLDGLGTEAGYLPANAARAGYWSARLPRQGLRVGLVWAGNPRVRNDKIRSPRLAPLLPLFDLPGVTFVILQHGDGRRDLEGLALPPNVLDLAAEARDLADTAALMSALDLVVSSDTATAHLAGALGRPGWIVLPKVPDWRWLMERTDSPWYPSLKLYRQAEAGDWAGVVARLAADLRALAGGATPAAAAARPAPAVAPGPDAATVERINQALLASRQGRHREALAQAEAVTADRPAEGMGWMVLGVVRRAAGRAEAALEAYRRAEALLPGNPELHNNLGNLLVDLGRHAEAETAYRAAIALRADWTLPWVGLVNALDGEGRAADALAAAEQALRRWPAEAGLLNARGKLHTEAGRPGPALADFDAALAAAPKLAEARYNRGVVLHKLERYRDAIDNDQALLVDQPDHVRARYNLALGLQQLGRLDEAELQYREALARQPDYHAAWINLAGVAQLRNDLEAARRSYAEILRRFPDDIASRVDALHVAQKLCDWQGFERLRETVVEPALALDDSATAPPPFPFLSFPCPISEAEQLRIAQRHARQLARDVVPLPPRKAGPRPAQLRIGYVSADFHNHATAHLMRGLFGRHDRARFEVWAYSFGPDDGSAYRARIAADCDRFVELGPYGPAECARRIHADGIDVLVDLKGYTRDSRPAIFAHRPAPLQLAWLGYPGSMGADFIDAVVTDRIVTPPAAQADYQEKLGWLPHCYQVNDDGQEIAAAPSREDCALPDGAFVFCCFNTHYKLDPFVFGLWMEILAAVPDSVLWLIDGYPDARLNLRREMDARGIDPDRLVFAGKRAKADHLARHAHADLFLDTRWYGAHTTASDALWAGVPVLSVAGETFASRVGASLLHAVGLPELVMADWDAYKREAIALAQSPARLAALKQKLAANRRSTPLFDTAGFVDDLEALYDRLWDEAAGH
ncbi:O-linked N-acetylglucosamine transferase family protein [Chitinimonas koreensis]|uniref:O-linked N-acetylglucosamine transferase family protein n=1 Tax=Chitinimonas koreensis TaxID=356302 RepID=UPI00146FC708|nr:tetratricopeptide repeat protein [Chitinimonas koreensis]QNM96197.1 tetratricopeptide repeat protein [Chitinimonas koreensis]